MAGVRRSVAMLDKYRIRSTWDGRGEKGCSNVGQVQDQEYLIGQVRRAVEMLDKYRRRRTWEYWSNTIHVHKQKHRRWWEDLVEASKQTTRYADALEHTDLTAEIWYEPCGPLRESHWYLLKRDALRFSCEHWRPKIISMLTDVRERDGSKWAFTMVFCLTSGEVLVYPWSINLYVCTFSIVGLFNRASLDSLNNQSVPQVLKVLLL